MSRATAVVLLSGGLDSVVAAAMWLDRGEAIGRCLSFDYGQGAREREIACAERFAKARGLPFERVSLPWLRGLAEQAGCGLVGDPAQLPAGTAAAPGDADSAAAVWVPARNAVFVSIAAAYAEAWGAQVVVAGFNREEAETFADNSEAFVAAANEMLQFGTRTEVRVESPTIGLDKKQIVAAARRLGVTRAELWSCYRSGPVPCGRCESCLRSEAAWGA